VEFEWDARKATSNLLKHGVSFGGHDCLWRSLEAMIADLVHSASESRFVSIRRSEVGRLLVVAYTEREGRVRIISARQAPPTERRQYESEKQPCIEDDILPEYDFSQPVRGTHYESYNAGTNVVFLDSDLAEVFKDSDSVNRVLRLLLKLAKETSIPSGSPRTIQELIGNRTKKKSLTRSRSFLKLNSVQAWEPQNGERGRRRISGRRSSMRPEPYS
jgi:uncharacterized DUF497 family protein